jgi:hypothetical protein
MIAETDDVADLFQDPRGPIERFSWGAFVIAGQVHGAGQGVGKDIRLIGRAVSRWKEREGHRLKKSMITRVYKRDIEVLILGIGVEGAVEVPGKVRRAIADHGISELIIERTPEACRVYNRLYHEGRRLALLAHGTC